MKLPMQPMIQPIREKILRKERKYDNQHIDIRRSIEANTNKCKDNQGETLHEVGHRISQIQQSLIEVLPKFPGIYKQTVFTSLNQHCLFLRFSGLNFYLNPPTRSQKKPQND